MTTLLPPLPPKDDPARARGNSMSSTSETSSHGIGSTTTLSTTNTSLNPPSPQEKHISPSPSLSASSSTTPAHASATTSASNSTVGTPNELVGRRASVSATAGWKPPPLTLHGVTSHAEAAALVELARREIVENAAALTASSTSKSASAQPLSSTSQTSSIAESLPSSTLGGRSLTDYLEQLGRTVQLEKHFAKGEAQKFNVHHTARRMRTSSAGSEEEIYVSLAGQPSAEPNQTVRGVTGRAPRHHRPVVRSASTSDALSRHDVGLAPPHSIHPSARAVSPSTTMGRSKKHRPIANMGYLQHKYSLEARLNRKYQAGPDNDDDDLDEEDAIDAMDAAGEEEFGVIRKQTSSRVLRQQQYQQPHPATRRPPALGNQPRRSASIEITHTLPTPTDSPVSTTSHLSSLPDSPTTNATRTHGHSRSNPTNTAFALPPVTEPVFKQEEGSPIYSSPLVNVDPTIPTYAGAEKPKRIPLPVPTRSEQEVKAFRPDYIPLGENAFPPRSQLGVNVVVGRGGTVVRKPSTGSGLGGGNSSGGGDA
ncbi:hypothetical protein DL93DRAFT_1761477 [Clavulina sp. PMI_390]|nr:hypothetical protein DL93DRAFT_1761477 [Clavulina sp. PMI_390]